MMKIAGYSESGRRVGQSHWAARLTDGDVELMRELHEAHPVGDARHWGYRQLARKFDCPRSTVRDICTYLTRVEPMVYKVVRVITH